MSADAILDGRMPSRGWGASAAVRRAAAFRAARLHTIKVRVLRTVLPLVGLSMIAVLALNSREPPSGGFDFSIASTTISPNGIVMEGPMLSGADGHGRDYRISAARAVHKLSAPNELAIERIEASITSADRGQVTVSAEHGDFNRATGALALTGLVRLVSDDGYELRLNSALFNINNGTMVSDSGVSIGLQDSVTVAERMSVSESGRIVTLEGSVKTTLMPPNRPGAAAAGQGAVQ